MIWLESTPKKYQKQKYEKFGKKCDKTSEQISALQK